VPAGSGALAPEDVEEKAEHEAAGCHPALLTRTPTIIGARAMTAPTTRPPPSSCAHRKAVRTAAAAPAIERGSAPEAQVSALALEDAHVGGA
jgi:hypothetical protein